MRRLVTAALLPALTLLPLATTKGCGAPGTGGGGPARSASYAGDGATQFGVPGKPGYANEGATGKLRWGRTYNAHQQHAADVQNCRWRLYTIDAEGGVEFRAQGTYANAKIKVGEQVTVKWFLKSLNCGLWQ